MTTYKELVEQVEDDLAGRAVQASFSGKDKGGREYQIVVYEDGQVAFECRGLKYVKPAFLWWEYADQETPAQIAADPDHPPSPGWK